MTQQHPHRPPKPPHDATTHPRARRRPRATACAGNPRHATPHARLPAILLACVLAPLLLLPSPAHADFNQAMAAYRAGDYQRAHALWLPDAQAGDPRAQTALGLLYYDGLGVDRDAQTAATWLKQAANQGNATAQFSLGVIREKGLTSPPDPEKARDWYALAASQGHARAQTNLGLLYYEGPDPIPQDLAEAALWLNRAAHQDIPQAQYTLARMYLMGQGLTRDPAKAAQWLARAADLGFARAQTDLAVLFLQGTGVEADPDAAFGLLQLAANRGQPQAQFLLADLYHSGAATPDRQPDPAQAAFWFALAADAGHPRAPQRLQQTLDQLTPAQRERLTQRTDRWLNANRPEEPPAD